MKRHFDWHCLVPAVPVTVATVILAACSSTALPPTPVASVTPAKPAPAVDPAKAAYVPPAAPISTVKTSGATTPRAYRQDAATHLYGLNHDRIYKGRMPPLLHAVGVLQVDVDGRGAVSRLNWMRKPSHAPEVVVEIERMVLAAAPFPAPVRMGRVTYTDTWLWHKSGRFQLDTLTEGQD